MTVVLDTGVLISAAIIKQSIPSLAVRKALSQYTVVRSASTTQELIVTLRKKKFEKYFRSEYERDFFVYRFASQSKLINVTHRVIACRDSTDDKFLELALSGRADCIVSSDPDLQVLNPFENISILSPKEFLEKF